MAIHANRKLYECNMCGNSFNHKYGLRKHTKKIHSLDEKLAPNSRPFECKICRLTYRHDASLRRHYNRAHNANVTEHTCKDCDQTFPFRYQLSTHRRRIHLGLDAIKPFQCDYCAAVFVKKYTLDIHLRCHTDERPYECDLCPKKFRHKTSIVTHLRTHTGEKFKCPLCASVFCSKITMNRHRSVVHLGINAKRFGCSVCDDKSFATAPELRLHLRRRHTGERPFSCALCAAQFVQRHEVTAHMKDKHCTERPFTCEHCGKAFTRLQKRNQHMRRVHPSADEAVTCDVCGRQFSILVGLKNHMRTHTGQKPYACDVCGRAFARDDTLRFHKTTVHTDERSYQCKVCARPFARYKTLKIHMNVHDGKRFSCPFCDKSYSQKNDCRRHVRAQHGSLDSKSLG